MARRHEGDARQRRNVQRLRVVTIHQVTGLAQPDEVLQRHTTTMPQRLAQSFGADEVREPQNSVAGEAYEVGQFSDRLSQILKPFLLDTMPGVVCGRLRRVNQDSTHVATDASTGTFVICHALHRGAWVYEASIVVHLSARAYFAGRVRGCGA